MVTTNNPYRTKQATERRTPVKMEWVFAVLLLSCVSVVIFETFPPLPVGRAICHAARNTPGSHWGGQAELWCFCNSRVSGWDVVGINLRMAVHVIHLEQMTNKKKESIQCFYMHKQPSTLKQCASVGVCIISVGSPCLLRLWQILCAVKEVS